MFIHKLAILSLVLVPSLGTKLHLRKAAVDLNTTYYPDSSLSFDNSTMDDIDFINQGYNDLEAFEYNTTDDLSTYDTLDDDGGGRLERNLGSQGDWSQCSSSSQCGSGCCSGKYSNGVLKCTPLGSGFNPSANGCVSASNNGGTTDSNAWIQAHNVRRQKYHSMYGVSYVPLKWSSSIAQSAQGYANKLIAMSGCVIEHGYQGDRYGGENLYANWGSSGVTSATPDQVLQAWAENEVSSVGGHFTQVIWRGTRYVGCATASKSNCYIQVCRYIASGNCNFSSSNWKQTTLADSSPCGPQCPAEGCF